MFLFSFILPDINLDLLSHSTLTQVLSRNYFFVLYIFIYILSFSKTCDKFYFILYRSTLQNNIKEKQIYEKRERERECKVSCVKG